MLWRLLICGKIKDFLCHTDLVDPTDLFSTDSFLNTIARIRVATLSLEIIQN